MSMHNVCCMYRMYYIYTAYHISIHSRENHDAPIICCEFRADQL
jgi:hypothetical protein